MGCNKKILIMKFIIQIMLFLFLCNLISAQTRPTGIPTQFSTGWFRHGYHKSDSGTIFPVRDTTFLPRFTGTSVIRPQNRSPYYYDSTLLRWRRILVDGDTFDTTAIPSFSVKVRSLFSGTSPIQYSNGAISILDATTAQKGAASFNASNFSVSGAAVSLLDMVTAGSCTNCNITFNSKGQGVVFANGTSGITQLTGDITAGPGSGSLVATISGNAITNAQFRPSSPLSLVGRSTNSTGNIADIEALADDEILRRSGAALGFGAINLASATAVGTSILNVANGGSGSAAPGLVAGTNVSITGSWPNQTINATGATTLYSGDGALAGTRVVSGAGNNLSLGQVASQLASLFIHGNTIEVGARMDFYTDDVNTDANYTVVTGRSVIEVRSNLTTDRTFTMPSASLGQGDRLTVIMRFSANVNHYQLATPIEDNKTGATFTQLEWGTTYLFHGSTAADWILIEKY